MRILFVSNELPCPPDNGVRIVLYNAMRLMRESGHEVGLACLPPADARESDILQSKAMCSQACFWLTSRAPRSALQLALTALSKGGVAFIERFASAAFGESLKQAMSEFRPDVVHFDLIPMTQYRDLVPARVGTIASINDSWAFTLENSLELGEYRGLERIYRRYEYSKVRRYEAETYARFDAVHVMSREDASYLHKLRSDLSIEVIGNGVLDDILKLPPPNNGGSDLLFLGQMTGGNLVAMCGFLDVAWPRILEANPRVRLRIVGKVGEEARGSLASRNLTNVTFLGYVPSLSSILSEGGICIVPINKRCGVINKALEGMAAGLAVVGFSSSFAGLPPGADTGRQFIAVERMDQFAGTLIKLLDTPSAVLELGREAKRFALDHLSWESKRGAYETMYSRAVLRAASR